MRQVGERQRRAKRRCKVYKCDEVCDTGATGVTVHAASGAAEEERDDALLSLAAEGLPT